MNWNDVIFHAGNEELQRFTLLGILAARLGIPLHFHVEGPRGTGKTTLIRAAKTCLPAIKRVKGCLYNCDPKAPHCPEHRHQQELATEWFKIPFLEISHSAKVGTVVGSIDLEKLTSGQEPEAAFLPGTLARAHRGIVFIDEINRLADTSPVLVDVLLDAMGTKPGRIQIEETGLLSLEMPLLVNVWAASNPDEEPGPLEEIRRQLSDRFDFAVRIQRPDDVDTVRAIMQARVTAAPLYTVNEQLITSYDDIAIAASIDNFLSELYLRFNLESIRGVQAARLGAKLHALLLGKNMAELSDLALVLPAALRHRTSADKLREVGEALQTACQRQQENTKIKKQLKAAEAQTDWEYTQPWRGIWQRFWQNKLVQREKADCQTENNSSNKVKKN